MLSGLLAFLCSLKLSQVAVVVPLHLQVKDLGLARGGSGDEVLVEELKNAAADIAKLLLDLLRQKPNSTVIKASNNCCLCVAALPFNAAWPLC